MIANSRCIACILSKQERKIRKNSDEQKKKEYIHKVLKILYEYGTKECAPMVEKRIKDIYKEYYEEDVDYGALKHRYNQYMLEKEEEIRAHIQKNNDIETCIKYVCAGNYIDFGVANKIDDQLLQGLLDKVNELKISKKEVAYLEDELAQAKRYFTSQTTAEKSYSIKYSLKNCKINIKIFKLQQWFEVE